MNLRFPKGDKIATIIARVIACFIGVLLIAGLTQIWNKIGIQGWIVFCALIGLILGYGVGGDIWGARLFDFFTGQNTRRAVEKAAKSAETRSEDTASKMLLGVLIFFLVLLTAAFVFSLYLRHKGY